jgi:hypothetical protein
VADLNHLFFAALPRPSWDPCPGWAVVIDFACTRAGFLARFAARSRRSSIRKVTLYDVALSRLTSTVRLRGLDWEYGRGSSRRLRRAKGPSRQRAWRIIPVLFSTWAPPAGPPFLKCAENVQMRGTCIVRFHAKRRRHMK